MKSFWTIAALVVGLSSAGAYAHWTTNGREYGAPQERFVPDEIRSKPGAYRGFHFWHVGYGGYRGGK